MELYLSQREGQKPVGPSQANLEIESEFRRVELPEQTVEARQEAEKSLGLKDPESRAEIGAESRRERVR